MNNAAETNLYQPPTANLIDESISADVELAGRGQRFGAALLDGLFGMAVAVPIMFGLGTFDYVRNAQQIPWRLVAISALLGWVGFVLLHGYFLKLNGQTIGKKMVGIRIANLDDSIPSIGKVLGLRYLPIQAAHLIPLVGGFYPLVDVLFIFREDRRCIHDLMAGTKVVKVK